MPSSRLHIVGVRHHSPACARLVAHTIRRVRPRYVLVEGPSDLNPRLDELLLGHELPIAVFSFHRRPAASTEPAGADADAPGAPRPTAPLRAHASWTPFAEHSPEWQALTVARELGAEPRFMDLPAWDEAFWGVENRYGDHARRYARTVERLCARLHVEGYDALWDHLFEGAAETDAELARLTSELAAYFEGTRGDEPAGPRDGPREAVMRANVLAALAKTDEPVVVVCGGYHAPALEVDEEPAPGSLDWPTVQVPEGAASWIVPWSFHRLDSFTGYESGMPSTAFYDAVFTLGPREAPERMLRVIVEHLRAAGQHVSSADLVAAHALAEGLARLRGHGALRRTDLLDALAAALVKQALDVPLPWSERGRVRGGTDALLVEVLRALSGRREGRLHPSTPRPPLLADVEGELARHGLAPGPAAQTVKLPLADAAALAKSRVLHRLRVLQIPGFVRQRGPAWATDAVLEEVWTVARHDGATSALIEASRFGATLAGAAARRLEEALDDPELDLDRAAAVLGEVVLIGLEALTGRALDALRGHLAREPDLTRLGAALARLLDLHGSDVLFGARGSGELAAAIAEAYARGVWLLEHVSGGSSAADQRLVLAVRALRDAARRATALGIDAAELAAVLARRAHASEAPPAVRGACLGGQWSLGQLGSEAEASFAAVHAVKRAATPDVLGDFLAGLFALAREETVHGDDVLRVVDEALRGLDEHDFLVAVPALRLAFAYFPPREKQQIAGRVARLHGKGEDVGRDLLVLAASAAVVGEGERIDRAVDELLSRYGLLAAEGAS